MKAAIIIDTSPLVAFIDKSDNFHHWTVPGKSYVLLY
jgi:hypothetical protein